MVSLTGRATSKLLFRRKEERKGRCAQKYGFSTQSPCRREEKGSLQYVVGGITDPPRLKRGGRGGWTGPMFRNAVNRGKKGGEGRSQLLSNPFKKNIKEGGGDPLISYLYKGGKKNQRWNIHSTSRPNQERRNNLFSRS